MASTWWVFIGTLLCFTPLLPLGIFLVAWYFIDLIFRNGGVNVSQKTYNDNTFNINNLNINTDTLLKRDFNKYRGKGPHPFMVDNGLEHLRPFDHEDMVF